MSKSPKWAGYVSRVEAAGRVIRSARKLATIVSNRGHLEPWIGNAVKELSEAIEQYDALPTLPTNIHAQKLSKAR